MWGLGTAPPELVPAAPAQRRVSADGWFSEDFSSTWKGIQVLYLHARRWQPQPLPSLGLCFLCLSCHCGQHVAPLTQVLGWCTVWPAGVGLGRHTAWAPGAMCPLPGCHGPCGPELPSLLCVGTSILSLRPVPSLSRPLWSSRAGSAPCHGPRQLSGLRGCCSASCLDKAQCIRFPFGLTAECLP